MPVDPVIRDLLDKVAGTRSLNEMSVDEARASSKAMVADSPLEDVQSIAVTTIDGYLPGSTRARTLLRTHRSSSGCMGAVLCSAMWSVLSPSLGGLRIEFRRASYRWTIASHLRISIQPRRTMVVPSLNGHSKWKCPWRLAVIALAPTSWRIWLWKHGTEGLRFNTSSSSIRGWT